MRLVFACIVLAGFASCQLPNDDDDNTLRFRPAASAVPNPLCPDKQGTCPDKSTCCKLSTGKYGCCPLHRAVCCSDHVHCCPEGFTCDVAAQRCNKEDLTVDWMQRIETNDIVCPGGKFTCPNGSTCCKRGDNFGCCPLPLAACCSDGVHCCPHGYNCNTKAGTCSKSKSSVAIAWIAMVAGQKPQTQKVSYPLTLANLPTRPKSELNAPSNNIKCGDGSFCPSSTTCCMVNDKKQYGCCPLPNAVCCEDNEHCCAQGTRCDVKHGTCMLGKFPTPMYTKFPSTAEAVGDVICPDQASSCPDSSTCCMLTSGQYGCCPMPQAVCCIDHLHCCPEGTTCDLSESKCNSALLGDIPWSEKLPAKPVEEEEEPSYVFKDEIDLTLEGQNAVQDDIQCPDKKSTCPSGTTCCEMQSGYYGCCPMENAKCCPDHLHCCASDETCDVAKGECTKSDLTSVPMKKKLPAMQTCPDNVSTCPTDTTCCEMQSGYYGCCPMVNAKCCANKLHCCAADEECEEEKGICTKNGVSRQTLSSSKVAAAVAKGVNDHECPDQKGSCGDDETCCLLESGSYGCCPYPQAVCCDDKKSCCPNGTTCNDVTYQCDPTVAHPLPITTPSLTTPNPLCPDGKGTCPQNNTCCLMDSGEYGCCGYDQAVCCADHKTCCPHGYVCNSAAKQCDPAVKGPSISYSLIMMAKESPNPLCPDGSSTCPKDSTCCILQSGQYGCCPYPNAVCCDDKEHCCPNGYTCDTATSQCTQGSISIPWLTKTPSSSSSPSNPNPLCPDGKGTCPQNNTCCLMDSGEYGCCEFDQAVCCADHKTCCPHGYVCNPAAKQCDPADKKSLQLTSIISKDIVTNVVCPDQQSLCPDGSTCCIMPSGQYGCCPMPNAVCCDDKEHCCPNGYTCDTATSQCTQGSISIPWLTKTPSSSSSPSNPNPLCPDGKGTCPQNNTCCLMDSGEYGCCGYDQAVCCADHKTCCPHGYVCNPAAKQCDPADKGPSISYSLIMMAKESPNPLCPDGSSTCPKGSTCCMMPSGEYGCCPMPDAVCCDDKEHCCPNGYTCDTATSQCSQGSISIPWLTKTPSSSSSPSTPNPLCPDGKGTCPQNNTCCLMDSGKYGCCGFDQAVCCADHKTCCPHGYVCNPAAKQCDPADKKSLQLTSIISKDIVTNVVCPDQQSLCPDGSTCCIMPSGQYGCCPMPNAVCCDDKEHCCPNGYTCDTATSQCSQGSISIPWLTKTPSSSSSPSSPNPLCPDGKGTCPQNNTCCLMDSGKYGCCGFDQAVCCADHKTCCPHGYVCNPAAKQCDPAVKGPSISYSLIMMAKESPNPLCPDGSSTCPKDSTCCILQSGQYGCCPYPNAVCCDDKEHCCPNGYTCDTATSQCSQGSISIPWLTKTPSSSSSPSSPNPLCPDGKGTCPQNNTCCLMDSGKYGCCGFDQAVCCADHKTCCPHGYVCNPAAKQCDPAVKGPSISYSLIMMAKESPNPLCPDGSSTCPKDSTCCILQSGQYGCCPYPNAVCCDDKEHCCPNGYTCDTATSQCSQGSISIPWLTKTPSSSSSPSNPNPLCPDGKGTCPQNNTCCLMDSGEYGCCGFDQAVCCADHKTCCPHGYVCNPAAKQCDPAGKKSLQLTSIVSKEIVTDVACPDQQSSCPDGNTCCKLQSGAYGCCPMIQAVCCTDGLHCCPQGTTCDTAHSRCVSTSNSLTLSWTTVHRTLSFTPPSRGLAVVCKDKSECPNGSTCCEQSSGKFACCPMPQAVCCDDKIHCCPKGYTCDVGAGQCTQSDSSLTMDWTFYARNKPIASVPWAEKVPAIKGSNPVQVDGVLCPDKVHQCPSYSTCCKLQSGQWGCCRFPQANCCSDHVHCCPSEFTCDTKDMKCVRDTVEISWQFYARSKATVVQP